MRKLVMLTLAALTGCSHSLTLTSRTTGEMGIAQISTHGNYGGNINIDLKNKTYFGHWVYMPNGSMGVGSAWNNRGMIAGASAMSVSMQGNGSVTARSNDGSTLHCVFNYAPIAATGEGECQDSTSEMYDLIID